MCMIFTVFDPTECEDHTGSFKSAVEIHEIQVLTSYMQMKGF